MEAQKDVVTEATDKALDLIRKKAPAEYAKLEADPAKMKQLTEAARAKAAECVKLAAEFKEQPTDIAERLSKHLSEDRIKLIRAFFSFLTFKMDVTKRDDGKYFVEISRNGKPFLTGKRELSTIADVDLATVEQEASIVIEAIQLTLDAVGVAVHASESTIAKLVREIVEDIKNDSQLEHAIQVFIKAWNDAGGSAYAKATAVFKLIEASFSSDIFWEVVKGLCEDMAWYDWLETAALVAAEIVSIYRRNSIDCRNCYRSCGCSELRAENCEHGSTQRNQENSVIERTLANSHQSDWRRSVRFRENVPDHDIELIEPIQHS